MKKLMFTCLLSSVLLTSWSQRPCRYEQEVFEEIVVQRDVLYGMNATVLGLGPFGQAVPQPLVLDLYEPVEDPCGLRPLVIYFHSGNFLPFPQNQSCVGTKQDSSAVDICTRLARSGYVVASADYRLGWNPIASDPIALTIGLINAAYRGVQDANTCIRFFKRSVVEMGNPYRVDTSRIILFGDDTGGYLSLNAGALDRYSKIPETPQFRIPISDSTFIPMIIEYLNGDVEGKTYGVNTPQAPSTIFPFPEGDTLCYPNHVNYSSDFAAAVSLGGAVGDSSWIDPGQPPVITVHTPYDLTTPYGCGTVYIRNPVTGQLIPVINVCGSEAVAQVAFAHGNTGDKITPDPGAECYLDFEQSLTTVALERANGMEGLLAIYGDTPTDFSPWEWWDCETNQNCTACLQFNPNMSREKASLYIDTILAYVRPRLLKVLNSHPWDDPTSCTATEDHISDATGIKVFPNPVADHVTFQASDVQPLRALQIFDLQGRLMHSYTGVNETAMEVNIGHLPRGIYIARIQTKQGSEAKTFVKM